MESYYPLNDGRRGALCLKYKALADGYNRSFASKQSTISSGVSNSYPTVIFSGRLAGYRYNDMALIIERVMGCLINSENLKTYHLTEQVISILVKSKRCQLQ